MEPSKSQKISILHFNDVYDIEPEQGKGGAARFYTALQSFKDCNPLIFFSGDVFSPSHLSNIHFGQQMILPMNKFNITACCFGNHDFDFELESILKLKNQTNFPWIMSNVYFKPTNRPLGEGLDHLIIEHDGLKIGLIGLAEQEWLGLLVHTDETETEYLDYVEVAKKYVKIFQNSKCDLIIALTHMRNHNDERLAKEVPEIDLILGGHDHILFEKAIGNTLILKSGCNFNEFSFLELDFSKMNSRKAGSRLEFSRYNLMLDVVHVDDNFAEDPDLKSYVDEYLRETEKQMEKTVGYCDIALDTRFSIVRTQETGICNFFADVIRYRVAADIAILNNGFIRSDSILEPGRLTLKAISKMIPFFDTACVLEMTGKTLIEALECGISKYPSYDGRFPSVSGLKFTFDSKQPAGKRVIKESIVVEKGKFNEEEIYHVTAKGFITDGKDGYEVLKTCKRIVDHEEAMSMQYIVAEFFNLTKSHFLDGFHVIHEVKHEAYVEKWKRLISSIKKDEEGDFISISPKIEGRITIL